MSNLTPTARVILGMLRVGARTGYDIKQLIDVSTRFFWGASYGQIYPELRKLEAAGLVRGSHDPRGGVSRTAYELTAKGERVLHEWLTARPEVFEYRDEALLKLFFGDVLSRDELEANLRMAREEFEDVARRFREFEAQPRAEGAGVFPFEALRFGIELMEWIAAWYADLERRLEATPAGARPSPQEGTAAPPHR